MDMVDNKYVYEKSIINNCELEAADHDHPLQQALINNNNDNTNLIDNHIALLHPSSTSSSSSISHDLSDDFQSVALDWKSSRNSQECSCSLYFDDISKKVCLFVCLIYIDLI